MNREQVVNRRVNPLLEGLPARFEVIRPDQVRAVREVIDAFDDSDLVFLEAPTGSGKTLIADVVRRMMRRRAVYTCTTKSLQEQVMRDFPESHRVMMGRNNYATELFDDEFPDVSCEDCTHDGCGLCSDELCCPYLIAKDEAARAEVAILNGSYLLNETRDLKHSVFVGRPLMIVDEADAFESELMRYASLRVSPTRMRKWKWEPPEKVTVADSWRDWLVDHLGALARITQNQKLQTPHDIAWARERRRLQRLADQMQEVLVGLDAGTWTFTGKDGAVEYKPAKVDYLGDLLWRISPSAKWLLMSATPISVEERLDAIGWEGAYRVVKMEHTFPVENRRVLFVPVGSMSRKYQSATIPVMVKVIAKLLARHPDERVLVHTHSYAVADAIKKGLGDWLGDRPLLTYSQSRDREMILRAYLDGKASVLFAPSMDRGVDLPDDACRVQVITKVPYPNLGDRQVSTRMHMQGGGNWYLCETIRTIVQMCGRGVRHRDDQCVTYVLDADFENVWMRGRGMMPKWFSEAVVWKPERVTG